MPFNVIVVDIPQRMQSVNGLSAVQAGIRLLPYSVAAPATSLMTTVAAGKWRIPFLYFLILGGSLQLIGAGLLTSLPSNGHLLPAQYGYEAIAGAGLGVTFGILMLGIPFAVEKKDLGMLLHLHSFRDDLLTVRIESYRNWCVNPSSNAGWCNRACSSIYIVQQPCLV
mgnify:CR=1 FL=1